MADNKLELVVEVDTKAANASIKSVNASLSSMEAAAVKTARGAAQGIDGMTASMAKAVAIGQAVYAAMSSAARALQQLAIGALHTQDMLAKTAQRIGIGVEELSALRHAAELSDVTMETLTTSIGRFAANISKGSNELDALGIATRRQDGSLRSMTEILGDVAERFAGMPDGVSKTALAMDLFGRSGKDLIPLLNAGRSGLAEMAREARELGRVIDEDTAKRAEHLNDNITRLKAGVEGLAFEIAQRAVPAAIRITDAMIRWVREGGLDTLVRYLREAAEWAKNIGLWIVQYAVIRHVIDLAAAMRSAAIAAGGLNAALMANPWGLAAAGVATFGVVLLREKQRLDQYQESMTRVAEKASLMKAISEGATLDQLRKQGYDEAAIRSAIGAPAESAQGVRRIAMQDVDVDEIIRRRARAADAEKRAAEILRQAREGELSGLARIVAEYERYRQELGLTAKAQRDLAEAIQIKLRAEIRDQQKRAAESALTEVERRAEMDRRALADRLRQELEFADETLDMQQQTARERLRYEETVAEQVRDARLRAVDLEAGHDAASQIRAVQQRLEIEQDYLMQRFALRADELRRESELEIATMEAIARARGIADEQIAARRDAILQQYAERGRQLEADTQAALDAARESAAARQAQIVRDHNQRIFDSFKRQAEGVFDALLTRSQSIWSAIANSLKTAIITAIKEILSSQVAALLMRLFAGVRMPVGAGGLAGLAGLATPALGMGVPIAGAPGGTVGIAGPVSLGGLGLRSLSAAGMAPLGLGGAMFGLTGAFRLGQRGGAGAALGVGLGAVSGLLGYGALTSMFPSLIAAGPVGWIAAAGIGAFAGIFGLFRKSAEEKAREKIKATYGVDIREKNILGEIVNIAKQGFGGNLDMAIRAPQVRELIELYALSTGQSTSGLPATVKPISLVQQGGSLFQSSPGGLTLDRIGSGTATLGSQATIVNLQIDSRTIGSVIIQNGRVVSQSLQQGMRASAGRRELAALQLSPSLVVS